MLHIRLAYGFTATSGNHPQLENPLFDILSAFHRTGSVAQAAQHLGLSYRHVWGTLKKWEASLGSDLVLWERGKRARLTGFGEKLLFAEQRAKARVLPQVDNLIAEMEREFALAFDPNAHVLSLYASHDLAKPQQKDIMAREAQLHLDLQKHNNQENNTTKTHNEKKQTKKQENKDRGQG